MSELPSEDERRDRAFRLLLACSDWPRSESRNGRIRRAFVALDGDWDSFMEQVVRHRMAAMAADALKGAGIDPSQRLLDRASRSTRNAIALTAEARRLIDRLAEVGITAIVLKGPVLSQSLYGEMAMRQSIDLDLLVSWDEFYAARQALGKAGYSLCGTEPPWDDWRLTSWRKGAKDISLVHADSAIKLELHHRLQSPEALDVGLSVAAATQEVVLAGRKFRTFAKDDQFAYLSVHEARNLWHRLKWLADIRALLAGSSVEELEALMVHSRRLGAERCAALALLLCHRLWQQEIPQTVLKMRDTDWRLAKLEMRSLDTLRDPAFRISKLTKFRAVLTGFLLRDDLAYSQSYVSAILSDPEMIASIKLPRSLRLFYLPLRLFYAILRKLRTSR